MATTAADREFSLKEVILLLGLTQSGFIGLAGDLTDGDEAIKSGAGSGAAVVAILALLHRHRKDDQ